MTSRPPSGRFGFWGRNSAFRNTHLKNGICEHFTNTVFCLLGDSSIVNNASKLEI